MGVTEKGQVTIPQGIREALGIVPSSEMEFTVSGDHAILRQVIDTDSVAEWLGHYKGIADGGMSTEEILALTRS